MKLYVAIKDLHFVTLKRHVNVKSVNLCTKCRSNRTQYSRFGLWHRHVNHLSIALSSQATGNLKVPSLLFQLLPVLHVLGGLLLHLRLQCLLGTSLLFLYTSTLHFLCLATSFDLGFPVKESFLSQTILRCKRTLPLTIAGSPPLPASGALPLPWPSSPPPTPAGSSADAPVLRRSFAPAA